MMTVGDLIRWLSDCDPAALVVLAKDREGNEFSPLDGMDLTAYVAETTWSGHLAVGDWAEDGEVSAVVLWPVN